MIVFNWSVSLLMLPWQQPDACHTDFDAVSVIRGELFFFKDSYTWRIREGRLQDGYPAQASRHWRGSPQRMDAAFEDKAGNIWFFQGRCLVLSGYVDAEKGRVQPMHRFAAVS